MTLERMEEFFTARIHGYDEHMLYEVGGCKEGYEKIAELMPDTAETLLDLGCGTGLELDEIFKLKPDIKVTGIDLTKAMLENLKLKHPNRNLTLIHGDYFVQNFGLDCFDFAVSFQTLHHFSHDKKLKLYRKIYNSLKTNGQYIECDYMCETQEQEDLYFAELQRIRTAEGVPENEYFHYDTPCTAENQTRLLTNAGFKAVANIWENGGTKMLVAKR